MWFCFWIKNSELSTRRCMWLPAPTVALVFVYPIWSSLSHCLLFCIWNVWSLHVSSCSRGLRRYTFTSCLLAFRFLWRYGAESRSVAFWRPDGMWESQIQVQLRVSPQSLFHHLHFVALLSLGLFVCFFVSLFVCLFVCLVGWLVGCLVGWLVVCFFGCLVVCLLFGWLVGWLFVSLVVWLFVCLFVCLLGWLVGWLVGCLFLWLFGCLFVCLFVCLVGWLVVCLVGWLVVWLVGWLAVCLVGWLVGCLVGWLVGCVKIQLSHEWPTCHNRMAQHQGPWVSLEYTVKTVRVSNTWSNTEFYMVAEH